MIRRGTDSVSLRSPASSALRAKYSTDTCREHTGQRAGAYCGKTLLLISLAENTKANNRKSRSKSFHWPFFRADSSVAVLLSRLPGEQGEGGGRSVSTDRGSAPAVQASPARRCRERGCGCPTALPGSRLAPGRARSPGAPAGCTYLAVHGAPVPGRAALGGGLAVAPAHGGEAPGPDCPLRPAPGAQRGPGPALLGRAWPAGPVGAARSGAVRPG